MTDTLALALAQINPTVGDLGGNAERIVAARDEAARSDADLVVFGELAVSGYPPEDLVLKTAFQDGVGATVRALAEVTPDGGTGAPAGCAVAGRRPSLQCRPLARRRRGGPRTPQARAAQLRRVRREARLRGRPGAGTDAVPGRAPRGHGVRGHVVPGRRRSPLRGGGRAPGRDQRISVRRGEIRAPSRARGGPGCGDGAPARLRQPGGRAGRAGVRRPFLRLGGGSELSGPAPTLGRRTSSPPSGTGTETHGSAARPGWRRHRSTWSPCIGRW